MRSKDCASGAGMLSFAAAAAFCGCGNDGKLCDGGRDQERPRLHLEQSFVAVERVDDDAPDAALHAWRLCRLCDLAAKLVEASR